MSEGRTINVHVEKAGNEKLEAEITRLTEALAAKDNILNQLAETTFREEVNRLAEQYPSHRQQIMDVTKPSEYEFIKAFLSGEKPSRKSSGSTSLRQSYEDNPLLREFDSPKEMMTELYKHALNPKSKYYRQANAIRNHLKSLYNEEPSIPKKLDLSGLDNRLHQMAIKELGKKFNYKQYTEFLHRKVREANAQK